MASLFPLNDWRKRSALQLMVSNWSAKHELMRRSIMRIEELQRELSEGRIGRRGKRPRQPHRNAVESSVKDCGAAPHPTPCSGFSAGVTCRVPQWQVTGGSGRHSFDQRAPGRRLQVDRQGAGVGGRRHQGR